MLALIGLPATAVAAQPPTRIVGGLFEIPHEGDPEKYIADFRRQLAAEASQPAAKEPKLTDTPADAIRRARETTEWYGVDSARFAEGPGTGMSTVAASDPDWVTLDECEAKYDEPGFNDAYWHKNKFSWCRSKMLVYPIIEVPSGRSIADVQFDLTYIGRGHNGQRTLDLLIEMDDWHVAIQDPAKWNEIRPGLSLQFHPYCNSLYSGSVCGDIPPLGQPFAEFPIMTNSLRDYWFQPTTTTAWSGDTNPQDLKGYYKFHPQLRVVHNTGLVAPSFNDFPQDDLRCDNASYGGSLGNGGCIFTNVTSFIRFSCDDGSIRESACFIKDAFDDITRTYPGVPGTYVPGQHNGSHGPLTRNYHQNGGINNESRTAAVNACSSGYGGQYTWRSDGQSNDCDEFPFLKTYQNANAPSGGSARRFAVRPVLSAHNQEAGRRLGAYYKYDRTLDGDAFYVSIVGSCPVWTDPYKYAPKLTAPQSGVISSAPVAFVWEASGPSGNPNTQFTIRIEDAGTGAALASHSTSSTPFTPDLETWRRIGEAGEVRVVLSGTGTSLTHSAAFNLIVGDIPDVPRFMVVGDSISHGNEGDYTWRYRLKQHFIQNGLSVDFVGPNRGTNRIPAEQGGQASEGGYGPNNFSFDSQHFARWGWQAAQAKGDIQSRVATYQPDYLLIELGFNDLGWGVSNPDGLLNDIRTFIANARAAKPDIRICVANVVHRTPLGHLPNLNADITAYNGKLAAAIPSMNTAESPVRLVDISSGYDPVQDAYDGLHPNNIGEFKIAREFGNAMAGLGVGPSFGSIPSTVEGFRPAAPAELTATATDAGITIAWGHSYGASGYWLYSRNATLGESFHISAFPIGADSWKVSWVTTGNTYEYYVVPVRGPYLGDSSPVDGATADPKTASGPTDIVVAPGSSYIDVSWVRPSGPYSSTISKYEVFYFDQSEFNAMIQTVETSGTSIRLNSVTAGHRYTIAISSVNAAGSGWPSAGREAIPGYGRPSTPTMLTARITSPTDIHVEWTGVAGAAGYDIVVRGMGEPMVFHLGPNASADIGWLFPGAGNYDYCVVAVNGSLQSSESNCIHGALDTPSLLAARILTRTDVELRWTPVPGATAYRVLNRNRLDGGDFNVNAEVTGTSHQVGWLFPGAGYWDWCVIAITPGTQSATSNCLGSQLDTPTLLDAQIMGPVDVRLEWTAVPGAVQYYVYSRDVEANPNGPFNRVATVNGTSHGISGLYPGADRWQWYVEADADYIQSPRSNIVRSHYG